MLDGDIAPHCEHVFVTGAFCAADAPTPVRSVRKENSTKKREAKMGIMKGCYVSGSGEYLMVKALV
jgi:hypothetical protein